jgi:hypothetical protein
MAMTICLVIWVALGLRYKVLIVVPATIVAAVHALPLSTVQGYVPFLSAGIMIVSLQSGYLLGVVFAPRGEASAITAIRR